MNTEEREWCYAFRGQPETTSNHLLGHIALELDRIATVLERLAADMLDQVPAPKEDRD